MTRDDIKTLIAGSPLIAGALAIAAAAGAIWAGLTLDKALRRRPDAKGAAAPAKGAAVSAEERAIRAAIRQGKAKIDELLAAAAAHKPKTLTAAFHRADIGDIDLRLGYQRSYHEGGGLRHIAAGMIAKRAYWQDSRFNPAQMLHRIPEIIMRGAKKDAKDSKGHPAIRLTYQSREVILTRKPVDIRAKLRAGVSDRANNWVVSAYPIIPGKKLSTRNAIEAVKKGYTHKSANKPAWLVKAGG
jgi:hypothetical protein